MNAKARQHLKRAELREESARNFDRAARYWAEMHGDDLRAALERRSAELERAAARLERDRAEYEGTRPLEAA